MARPYISDLRDFTDAEKVIALHPFVVGEYVRLDVEDWRAQQLGKLQAQLDILTDSLEQSETDQRLLSEIDFVNQVRISRF